jgi:hypothetical protein
MAFCSTCGTKLEENVRFCAACGAATAVAPSIAAPATPALAPDVRLTPAVTAPPPAGTYPATAAAAPRKGGVLKVLLIVAGVLVLLAVLAVAGIVFVGYRMRQAFSTSQSGGRTTVTTPFGKVTSNEGDAAKIAADLNMEVYPGATAVQGSSATVNFGGMAVGAAQFRTGDSLDSVAQFYRSRYPNSTVNASDPANQSIMVRSGKGLIVIGLRAGGDGMTLINISRMGGVAPQ